MTPHITLPIDDGSRCWLHPLEAAAYTGTRLEDVHAALLAGHLTGVRIPGGEPTDQLVPKADVEEWFFRITRLEPVPV